MRLLAETTGFVMPALSTEPAIASVFAPRAAIDAEGSVEGYASLFGQVDQARDMIMPGAFAETLTARGLSRVPMLFQHDPSEPVGIWLELREDHRGLLARGRLIPEVARGRELLSLVRAGAIDGLSIGFRTAKARMYPKSIRRIYAVDLWEISIVTFPMLMGARVQVVKHSPARQRAELEWAQALGKTALPDRPDRRLTTRNSASHRKTLRACGIGELTARPGAGGRIAPRTGARGLRV